MDIKHQLTEDTAKKIFGSQARAKDYLEKLSEIKPLAAPQASVWQAVVDSWDYDLALKIVRNIFRSTPKYARGKQADQAMEQLLDEWRALELGDIAWPFSQGAFDGFVQSVNAELSNGADKDKRVQAAALRYRRIKEINTVRNDFIETLIFEKNQSIMPTLNHHRGVDFFIDGISYDQKVAKSPTGEFKKDFKEKWRQVAIDRPELVAEYLYTCQDEGRFGADPRLLVVYIDEDVSADKIREIVDRSNLAKPTEISFTYNHRIEGPKTYKVPCFVILLHN